MFSLCDKIHDYRDKWHARSFRMKGNGLPKLALPLPFGMWSVGRPVNRWAVIQAILEAENIVSPVIADGAVTSERMPQFP